MLFAGALQIGLHRLLHDLLQWYTLIGGDAAAVLVFGRVTGNWSVHARHFDSDLAEPGTDRLPLARQDLTAFLTAADTECGGLGKNDFGQIVGIGRFREHGEYCSRPV